MYATTNDTTKTNVKMTPFIWPTMVCTIPKLGFSSISYSFTPISSDTYVACLHFRCELLPLQKMPMPCYHIYLVCSCVSRWKIAPVGVVEKMPRAKSNGLRTVSWNIQWAARATWMSCYKDFLRRLSWPLKEIYIGVSGHFNHKPFPPFLHFSCSQKKKIFVDSLRGHHQKVPNCNYSRGLWSTATGSINNYSSQCILRCAKSNSTVKTGIFVIMV
jgi:hypothetical protein